MKNKQITIKEVAERANVSIATVSKVINEKDQHISEQTRHRIFKIIDELGYVPNGMAKSLKEASTKTLGLLIPDMGNAFPEMAKGAQDEAFLRGYTMFLCSTDSNPVQEEKIITTLRSKKVDGIIYISSSQETSLRFLTDIKIPVVSIDRCIIGIDNIGSIHIDNYQAMKSVAEYVYNKGCQKIAYISADISQPPSNERYAGLVDGLKSKGLSLDKKLHYQGSFSVEAGHIGALSLLQRDSSIDCIICGNDLIAIGAINVCQKISKKIPDDIKIIGFDDIFISKYINPELTTVRQDAYEMGKQAVIMLINHIEKGLPLDNIVLPFEIIERNTM